MAGSVSGPSALAGVRRPRERPLALVPAFTSLPPAVRWTSHLTTTRSQTVALATARLCTWRRDAPQGRIRCTGHLAARHGQRLSRGRLVHVFLLVGLMLLLLAMLKARDAALRPPEPAD